MKNARLDANKCAIALSCAAVTVLGSSPNELFAQTEQKDTLMEIVVTAQKREQLLQDVPISITALTAGDIQGNRIETVTDLNAVAPNLAVRATAGGSGVPAFSMRGVTSYGVVPGSDKEISIYVDGIYLGNATGATFEFPDIQRVEVLRGPQGTLFGRNSTAGAISVVTPDPTGVFDVHQELTGGNYAQFRTKTSIDLPAFGPLSIRATYVHDQRRGDIENLGAGQNWLRSEPGINQPEYQVSPKYLGNEDVDAFFLAAKFTPTDKFKLSYKLDYAQNRFTPEGNAVVGVNPAALGPAGILLSTLVATQTTPVGFDTSGQRPSSVNNNWQTAGFQRNWGQNLTGSYQLNDQISFQNILGYRQSFITSNDQLDGLGGLTATEASLPIFAAFAGLPPAAAASPQFQALVGSPFEVLTIASQSSSKQLSDEPQINFDSKYLTVTAGALYFKLDTIGGAPPGLSNTYALSLFPGGIVPPGVSTSKNYEASRALYTQVEAHLLPQLDLIGGYRWTHDDKSGTLYTENGPLSFSYTDTKPSVMGSLDYKPIQDVLAYVKYSTGFVTGGAVGPVSFLPETASSWETGAKAALLNNRLSADIAFFDATYHNLQTAQSGVTVGQPTIGTLIIDQGGERARGMEFEAHAVPLTGLTLGAGVGYTGLYFTSVNALLGTLGSFPPTLTPKWTTDISAQYQTRPVLGNAYLVFRTDTTWRARERTDPYPQPASGVFQPLEYSPQSTIVNARIALQGFDLLQGHAQIALWSRNLNNNRAATFPDILGGFVGATTFQPARTFGIDVIYDYK